MRKPLVVIMLLSLAALAHGRPVIYSIQTNVRASLTFPASKGIKTLEYLAGDELIKVALQTDDGTVTFTPKKGFSGTDTFKYTVNDTAGLTSNVATVTVNVVK